MCACVHACMCVCVRACVRAYVRNSSLTKVSYLSVYSCVKLLTRWWNFSTPSSRSDLNSGWIFSKWVATVPAWKQNQRMDSLTDPVLRQCNNVLCAHYQVGSCTYTCLMIWMCVTEIAFLVAALFSSTVHWCNRLWEVLCLRCVKLSFLISPLCLSVLVFCVRVCVSVCVPDCDCDCECFLLTLFVCISSCASAFSLNIILFLCVCARARARACATVTVFRCTSLYVFLWVCVMLLCLIVCVCVCVCVCVFCLFICLLVCLRSF